VKYLINKIYLQKIWQLFYISIGAALAIGLALYFVGPPSSPLLLASLGGSTIFLFALTDSPAAQPRSLFGGHLGGAFIGIMCFKAFGDGLWVPILAVVLSLILMLTTRTVHPPAGANPLIMVYGHGKFLDLLSPVALGVAIIFVIAVIWSRISKNMVRYPVNWFALSPASLPDKKKNL
jgi:CBS-domain-containing membrane protein